MQIMDIYKLNLNTYSTPPIESCSLLELEQLCEERLQLYKIMDQARNLNYKLNSISWENYVEQQILERKLRTYTILLKTNDCQVGQYKARRDNHIAHWLLSLCYSRTKNLRFFFKTCELSWFVMLYKRMTKDDLEEFFTQYGIGYTQVSEQEKNMLQERLITCRPVGPANFNSVIYYKTKFNEVSNLVAVRKVFLCKGFAYFPKNDIMFCLKNKLWNQFNRQLVWIKKMLPTNIKEERLEFFLNNLPVFTPQAKKFSDGEVNINLDNIDEVAKVHFPLCMKSIHSVLRMDHHLKYDCKMQYGIFLKWVGLSYEHAMELWKSEFTQKMSTDWFDRKYSYLFKHQYGKVGGKIQYNPYTCEKILTSCPGPGQHHGCPFRDWDLDKLLQKCQIDGFNVMDLNELKQLVFRDKYKDACTLYFNATRDVHLEEVVRSPNEYFEASYEFEDSLNTCLDNIFEDC